jgi:hypothetical protein
VKAGGEVNPRSQALLGNALGIKALLCFLPVPGVTGVDLKELGEEEKGRVRTAHQANGAATARHKGGEHAGPLLHWPSRAWRASAFPSGSLGTRQERLCLPTKLVGNG